MITEEAINDQELLPAQLPETLDALHYSLEPNKPYTLEDATTLIDPRDLEQSTGIYGTVPAVIEMGKKRLMVVDLRMHEKDQEGRRKVSHDPNDDRLIKADFIIIDTDPKTFDLDNKQGFKGVRAGEPAVVLGRKDPKTMERFKFDDEVSKQHLSVGTNEKGELVLTDINSTNGTNIIVPGHRTLSGRTARAIARINGNPLYEIPDSEAPYGYYLGYRILGKHSDRIDGGIYLGGSAREAIVVDGAKDPLLERAYAELHGERMIAKLVQKELGVGQIDISETEKVLTLVRDFVERKMRYDGNLTENISERYNQDEPVYLGEYIQKGVGVCRHQGLFSAYLAERLIQDGVLPGQVRIERNTIPDFGGSHAWATIRIPQARKAAEEFVIDPAQHFVGTKRQAMQAAGRWDYYLPLE